MLSAIFAPGDRNCATFSPELISFPDQSPDLGIHPWFWSFRTFYFADVGMGVADEGSIEEGDLLFDFGVFGGVDLSHMLFHCLAVFRPINVFHLPFRLAASYRLVVDFVSDLDADWKVVGAANAIHNLPDTLFAEGAATERDVRSAVPLTFDSADASWLTTVKGC